MFNRKNVKKDTTEIVVLESKKESKLGNTIAIGIMSGMCIGMLGLCAFTTDNKDRIEARNKDYLIEANGAIKHHLHNIEHIRVSALTAELAERKANARYAVYAKQLNTDMQQYKSDIIDNVNKYVCDNKISNECEQELSNSAPLPIPQTESSFNLPRINIVVPKINSHSLNKEKMPKNNFDNQDELALKINLLNK